MEKVLVSGIPELYISGTTARAGFPYCSGCQHGTIERLICEVIEELGVAGDTIGVAGVGCTGRTMLVINTDGISALHGRPPDVATGIKRSLMGRPVVYTLQGDGDCASIGAGALVGAASRAERITIIMANNTNYGTTGGQMAPTTLLGQVTSTTPQGRSPRMGYPLHVAELMAGIQGVAYSARGALTDPVGYRRTRGYLKTAFLKQMDDVGLGFVEILCACPTNWRLSPVESLKWIEQAVVAEFPLGEFKNVDNTG